MPAEPVRLHWGFHAGAVRGQEGEGHRPGQHLTPRRYNEHFQAASSSRASPLLGETLTSLSGRTTLY